MTLIAAEAMDAVALEGNISIEPAATRRNVLTRGIDVNELVGKRFRIGDVECEGVELCEPCAHLESMTQPGVIKALVEGGAGQNRTRTWAPVRIPTPRTSTARAMVR